VLNQSADLGVQKREQDKVGSRCQH